MVRLRPRRRAHDLQHVHVRLTRGADGYPPVDAEELDASPAGPDLWRIEVAPTFLQGVARGDVVRAAAAADGILWATEVVSSAGNWCARVVPLGGRATGPVAEAFRAIGCSVHETRYRLVVIDPPTSVPVVHVRRLLESGRAEGRWDFDLGVVPDGWSGADKPAGNH